MLLSLKPYDIDILSFEAINFVEKHAQIINVLSVFKSDAFISKCFGMKPIIWKKSTVTSRDSINVSLPK